MSTFEARYSENIAALRERIEHARAAGDVSELARLEAEEMEYIMKTVPFIQEYDKTTESTCRRGRLDAFVKIDGMSQHKRIFTKYMYEVEGVGRVPVDNEWRDEVYACNVCDGDLFVNSRESCVICPTCGSCRTFVDFATANLTFEQESGYTPTSQFAYQRSNHFAEWLNSLQGKENTDIPQTVLDAVSAEFKKIKATVRSDITPERVREFLRKLGLTTFYEHTYAICYQLGGVPPPKFSPALEEKLKRMFLEIQEPFRKHCPPKRKNFLSYGYVLYKFCELLEADDFLKYLPLLKSTEKLFNADQIWKNICAEVQWQFIPSV